MMIERWIERYLIFVERKGMERKGMTEVYVYPCEYLFNFEENIVHIYIKIEF